MTGKLGLVMCLVEYVRCLSCCGWWCVKIRHDPDGNLPTRTDVHNDTEDDTEQQGGWVYRRDEQRQQRVVGVSFNFHNKI